MVISYWTMIPFIIYDESYLFIARVIMAKIRHCKWILRYVWWHLRHLMKMERRSLCNASSSHVTWLHHDASYSIR